jgi:hypothetical protein
MLHGLSGMATNKKKSLNQTFITSRMIGRQESAWGVPNVSGARKSSSIATFGERT